MSSKCQVLMATITLVMVSACSSPSKKPGKVVVSDSETEILDLVSFKPGTAELEPSSAPILDSVVSTLQGNPNILEVEVQSHTDERGDDDANLKLSEQRAQAVMKYLVDKGVEQSRLTAHGYGETQPIDRAQTPEAWAKNARIAFLILKRRD
ncbi:MAG TPA: OmpA family protein [Kofleriaceae bacterium]|nr:OmpA family protein [Kofleriaceae bacterium]